MEANQKTNKETKMGITYDRVYYFRNGRWNEAFPNVWPEYKDIDTLLADVERMGYYAVKGNSNVGSPEGAPGAN